MEQYYGYIVCLVIGFFVAMLFCRSSLKKEYEKKIKSEREDFQKVVKKLKYELRRAKDPKYRGSDDLDDLISDDEILED
jgi:gas vesicle protein